MINIIMLTKTDNTKLPTLFKEYENDLCVFVDSLFFSKDIKNNSNIFNEFNFLIFKDKLRITAFNDTGISDMFNYVKESALKHNCKKIVWIKNKVAGFMSSKLSKPIITSIKFDEARMRILLRESSHHFKQALCFKYDNAKIFLDHTKPGYDSIDVKKANETLKLKITELLLK